MRQTHGPPKAAQDREGYLNIRLTTGRIAAGVAAR